MGLFRIRGLEMRLKPFLSTSTHLLNQSRSLQTLPAYGHNRGVSYIASLVFRCRAAAGCARSPRLFFSVSSHQELEWREEQRQPLSSFIKDDRQDRFRLQQDKPGRFVPVRAFFLSTSSRIRLTSSPLPLVPPTMSFLGSMMSRVTRMLWSLILRMRIVEKHASGLLPEMRKDDYVVVEIPTLKTWMQGGLDYIMLKNLSIDGIRIIGSVLGQSIALDYYIGQVDGMVAEFTDINHEMKKIGTFTVKKEKLFQLVGKANSNLADVILKLGLFERSDIAWKSAKYAQIWEYLRDEYELTQRFGSLDYKLKFVEHNIHTFQDILQNRKSVFMECLIIVLIALEILISLYSVYTH
ncbi:protein RETARDED ROOT GROWTH-LIKE isoform X3 [Musa acuminata AAA Group]|uniref:protein RETARDED ROOT GROWTH-LIKE isoform X3 n=1 Tax=Musa acuminata AAA Group TaxID=214697 RepID=UPI0031DB5762